MIRPGTGVAPNFWYYRDILEKYAETDEGEQLWKAQWQRSQTQCIHGAKCKRAYCEVGKAVQTVNIVSGQFVVLWGFLAECIPRGKRPRLVQVQVQSSPDVKDDKAKNDKEATLITGVRIMPGSIAGLKTRLALMQEQQERAGACA